jgi:hypothetical protein
VDLYEKAILVTSCGGPYGSERLGLPHFLDNKLPDSGEVVSLTHQMIFTPKKIYDTHFC